MSKGPSPPTPKAGEKLAMHSVFAAILAAEPMDFISEFSFAFRLLGSSESEKMETKAQNQRYFYADQMRIIFAAREVVTGCGCRTLLRSRRNPLKR